MNSKPLPASPSRARPAWSQRPRSGQLVTPAPSARAPEENTAAQTRLRWLGCLTQPDPDEAGG